MEQVTYVFIPFQVCVCVCVCVCACSQGGVPALRFRFHQHMDGLTFWRYLFFVGICSHIYSHPFCHQRCLHVCAKHGSYMFNPSSNTNLHPMLAQISTRCWLGWIRSDDAFRRWSCENVGKTILQPIQKHQNRNFLVECKYWVRPHFGSNVLIFSAFL